MSFLAALIKLLSTDDFLYLASGSCILANKALKAGLLSSAINSSGLLNPYINS